tara:strand:+ start:15 stop:479 length:465 start_codon:yes stop_codon:yes gene_type:complete
MVNIDKLKQILDRQDVFVKFTKKNGEERVMRCTRSVHLIPKDQLPKGIGIVKDGVTPVYDLDNDGWRSFSNDSVISYEFTEMQNDFDVFFNRVLEEAHKASLPEVYIARYLESFIRYNLYETCPEVREKIANLNELHERLSSEVDYEQLDKNFL